MKVSILGSKKGFSLVELMVVVAIIGILTSIAVPKFQSFRAKAIRAEANATLTNINTLQQLYYTDNDAYGTDSQINFSFNDSASKYNYVIDITAATTGAAADGQAYFASATSKQPLCPAAGGNDEIHTRDSGRLSIEFDGLDACD